MHPALKPLFLRSLKGLRSGRLLALVALIGLAGCSVQRSDHSNRQAPGDDIHIARPTLSSDGRYLAFDFFVRNPDGTRSPFNLALYDIETESLELLNPKDERLNFLDARFSPDDKYLALVQFCWQADCPPTTLGHQVGLLRLEDRAFRQFTSSDEPTTRWRPNALRDGEIETTIIRSSPVYMPSEQAIFYMSGTRPSDKVDEPVPATIVEGWPETRTVRRAGPEVGSDRMAFERDQVPLVFRRLGRMAMIDQGKLVISGHARRDANTSWGVTENGTATIYDPVSREARPAFRDGMVDTKRALRKYFLPRSITGTTDENLFAFYDASYMYSGEDQDKVQGNLVYIWRDSEIVSTIGISNRGRWAWPEYISLSGDGKWLVMFLRDSWREPLLVRVENGDFRELPLRVRLNTEITEQINAEES